MKAPGLKLRVAAGGGGRTPTRAAVLANLAMFQATWFAAVFGAAYCIPLWSVFCVACAVLWHLGLAESPAREARLVAAVTFVGFIVETANGAFGYVAFPSCDGAAGWLPPYWLVAMWALFSICLNVSLRWLRGRWLLACAFGAFGGPVSFAAGARLGAAQFVETVPGLLLIATTWAWAMPVLVWLSMQFDGVSRQEGEA
ncbi:DUF2878 domain-containing protein [Variovorax ureilyticus]|uniref:DUF2878 domain-containing protein n=1 Tax=Variovorax ureilyticus TaxID=1836198 RepID=A0ABU8VHU4_9BURK